MKLEELRNLIDQIDEKIIQLLNERCKIAGQVGVWKIENGHPIFVPEREKILLEKLKKQNKGPMMNESLTYIYREIISGAIAIEQPLKIGYCFDKRHYSVKHPARLTFGDSAEYLLMDSEKHLFSALENGDINYGVVSFYDGKNEFNGDTVDSLLKTNMNIVAERVLPDESTSLIIGEQSPVNTGDDRSAFRFEIGKSEENLNSVICILEKEGIEIICCELRISQENIDNNLVFMEVAGHPADKNIKNAMNEIEKICRKLKLLGGYPIL
jgi:chorismate mutase-like protein